MVRAALEGAEKAGAETELILLRNLKIDFCGGCGLCPPKRECHVHDDMRKIYPKLFSADAVVLGTPCYFNNMSGTLKNFIDRLNPFWDDARLMNKRAVLLCVGGQGGASVEAGLRSLREFCKIEGWDILTEVGAKADRIGDLKKADLEKCRSAGAELKK